MNRPPEEVVQGIIEKLTALKARNDKGKTKSKVS
jgi:hypothetical protein